VVAWTTVITVAVVVGLVGYSTFWMQMRSVRGVAWRLRRRPTKRVRVKVRRIMGAWDPSDSRHIWNGDLKGPGVATYSLDDEGVVTVEFRPKSGLEERKSGSIPVRFAGKPPSRKSQLIRRFYWAYVSSLFVGCTLGYLLAHGAIIDRVLGGIVGILVAMAVGWFISHLLTVVIASSKALGTESQPGEGGGSTVGDTMSDST
jgi:hypothetical protein